MALQRLMRAGAAGAAAAAMSLAAGAAFALSTPDEFEFTLTPQATATDYSLLLLLKRSFTDVLAISALVEPSWVGPAQVGDVVQTVLPSPDFAGALFTGTTDNPAYELAYFDETGLVLGSVDASPAAPVTVFTWGLNIAQPLPPGSTITGRLNVELLDPTTFDPVLVSGAQTLAAPVPEPATWLMIAAGLAAVAGTPRRRRAARRSVVVDP
jgi:hypothetical protein